MKNTLKKLDMNSRMHASFKNCKTEGKSDWRVFRGHGAKNLPEAVAAPFEYRGP